MSKTTLLMLVLLSLPSAGCERSSEISARKAEQHLPFLVQAAETDVREVRSGLPHGAEQLAAYFEQTEDPGADRALLREALESARGKVQELRIAKSTFFAWVDRDGTILRNDQEQDLMVGKNAFASFPEVKGALEGRYVETRGSMDEASGVRGRPDAQWVAAQPIRAKNEVVGLYLTGWSWSAYAYRLENAIRGKIRSEVGQDPAIKEPLVYVYVVVEDAVYGAPVSPMVNAEAIARLKPLEKAHSDQVFVTELEITGRGFGLAVRRVPALREGVAIALLRSET